MPLTNNLPGNNFGYSLLVPCYNASKYIEKFIENLSGLNKPFDEVLFYDDASTDDTVDKISAVGFTIISGDTNKGPGYARNKLAGIAKYEFIHFHDIDDGMRPDYLVKTSEIAEQGKYDVILCNVNWYDAKSEKLLLSWEYSDTGIRNDPLGYTISNPIGGINGLYRKDKFLACGGFDTGLRIWEDADLHVRLAADSAKFYVIEEELSYSLRYGTSASSDQSIGWTTRLNLLKKYLSLFKDTDSGTVIGKQAQIAASNLILLQQYDQAKIALELSEDCNVKVPDSNSKMWRLLKGLLPRNGRVQLRLLQLKFAFKK